MTTPNRHFRGAHISNRKIRQIVRYFALDLSATQIAQAAGVNRNTVNRYVNIIRERIAQHCEQTSLFSGEVELDESYFGGRKKGDKRGRGAPNKVPVFGILKRDGKVYTQVIRNASKSEIRPIIKRLVGHRSTIYTDKWRAYDGLVLNGYKHYRINHSKTLGSGTRHINGIENFWGWAKRRLTKFCGVSRKHFHLHLKECEWRFNHRHLSASQKYDMLMKMVRDI